MSRFIELIPTWEALVPAFRAITEGSKDEAAKEKIWAEITRMAQTADKYVAMQKEAAE